MAQPFRQEDLERRITELRERREALTAEVATQREELRRLRPWRWGRFTLGFVAPIISVLFMAALVFGCSWSMW
jgi:hypothetical protein